MGNHELINGSARFVAKTLSLLFGTFRIVVAARKVIFCKSVFA